MIDLGKYVGLAPLAPTTGTLAQAIVNMLADESVDTVSYKFYVDGRMICEIHRGRARYMRRQRRKQIKRRQARATFRRRKRGQA